MPNRNEPTSTENWDVVSEARTKIIFDTDGDTFVGYYEGPEAIVDPNTEEVYNYLNFRSDDGDGFTTSAGYQLSRAFANITQGSFVKIQRLSESKTAKGTMTNYRVMVRK